MSLPPEGATWVRFPRYVGDAVMHLPLLHLLKEVTHTPLVVWGPSLTVSLVEGTRFADAVHKEDGKPGALSIARTLRDHRAVRSVHFPKSLRPALGSFLARIPERIGVSESLAGPFNTHTLPFWSQTGPARERYRRVLLLRWPDMGDLTFPDFQPAVPPVHHPAPYICFMPGASRPEKAWEPEHFRQLARFAESKGFTIIVLGSASERGLGELVAGPVGVNLCGMTTLAQSAAWLRGSRVAVGNDSGLAHLAAATGAPTLAVFGSTDPSIFMPFGPTVEVVLRQGLTQKAAQEALVNLLSQPRGIAPTQADRMSPRE